jgi:hypothetical protein
MCFHIIVWRKFWENSGKILGKFWENSGKILGKFRENSGKILKNKKFLADEGFEPSTFGL